MSGLILPPGADKGPQSPHIELYDTELLEIEKITQYLNQRTAGHRVNIEDYDQEIRDKYRDVGLDVTVTWWTSESHGFVPEVQINGRLDKTHEFDHDRMVHEVTNDVLGIEGGGGVIKTPKL